MIGVYRQGLILQTDNLFHERFSDMTISRDNKAQPGINREIWQ
jgi:hypothetical protein